MPVSGIIKGDQKDAAIAAASILAKVERDRIMVEYHQQYPEYGFASHKGYPTALHRSALETHGITEIHRKSYAPVARYIK
jgi:ribonuclease HII